MPLGVGLWPDGHRHLRCSTAVLLKARLHVEHLSLRLCFGHSLPVLPPWLLPRCLCLRGSARPGVALSVFLLGICSASQIPSPVTSFCSFLWDQTHVTCTSSFLPLPPSGLASECPSLEGRRGQGTQGCCATARAAPDHPQPMASLGITKPRTPQGRAEKAGLRGHPGRLPGGSAVATFGVSEHRYCGDFTS